MKAILVPVETHETARIALRLAALVGADFQASIEGFALRRPLRTPISWDPADVAMIGGMHWDDGFSAAEARTLFEDAMREGGIEEAPAGGSTGKATWRWNGKATGGDEFLGSHARAFDLAVVGQPGVSGKPPAIATLEAALFDSGGPILIAPRRPAASFGQTAVIVWNGSSETARTIAFALPLLRRARRVVILADDGGLKHTPPGALIRERLEQNGIPAELKTLGGGAARSGEAILRKAAALGCDLLVKGAYTQSRLRQMIFGGVTSHVLAEADIPVFMAH